MSQIPAITGRQLIQLLRQDGWKVKRHMTHGLGMYKIVDDEYRMTLVQNNSKIIKPGTLGAILGPRQTGLGKKGLAELIKKYGLR